jgi:hypothetical protein
MLPPKDEFMYGLRKISKDGKNGHNDFVWPLTVGAEVEAPDWNPKQICGGGLHCLPNARGDWYLLEGDYWAVLEFDEKDKVQIDSDKCKVKKCKIVFLSEKTEGILKYFDVNKFDSRTAYFWARNIGNQDIMIDRITNSYYAYCWAANLGDRDKIINRIKDPIWAFYWACNFGDRDIMIERITDPAVAYRWVLDFGDKDIMMKRFPSDPNIKRLLAPS